MFGFGRDGGSGGWRGDGDWSGRHGRHGRGGPGRGRGDAGRGEGAGFGRGRGGAREGGWGFGRSGHGAPWGEGPRMRRGDVRTALLLALVDGPAHGYELSTRLEQKSGGAWRPSPGSVYPTLQLLADEGLVEAEERDGKRIYALTKAGKTEATERGKSADVPWQQATDEDSDGLREAVHGLKLAARQVFSAGNEEQRQKARAIIVEARRQLYELLAKG